MRAGLLRRFAILRRREAVRAIDRREHALAVRRDAPMDAAERRAFAEILAPHQLAVVRIERPDRAGFLAGEQDVLAVGALRDDHGRAGGDGAGHRFLLATAVSAR